MLNDYKHIREDGAVAEKFFIADSPESIASRGGPDAAHKDALQVIPGAQQDMPGVANPQYALASIRDVIVREFSILSASQLQGVVGFDGSFDSITIGQGVIRTLSAHKITFNGLRSGSITNMLSGKFDGKRWVDEQLPVQLHSSRVGGGIERDGKIYRTYVSSWRDESLQYEPILIDDSVDLVDTRGTAFDKWGVHIAGLDEAEFKKEIAMTPYLKMIPTQDRALQYQLIARKHGDCYGFADDSDELTNVAADFAKQIKKTS